jgi:serine O-acetyltransferase
VASTAAGAGFFELVREDFRRHGREWSSPGFQALAVHRFGCVARARNGLSGRMLRKLHRVCFVLMRNVYGIELPATAVIGRRMYISHPHGVIVNDKAVFGDDCALSHNVTIGIGVAGKRSVPQFGDRVWIGPGAIVLGRVTIGDDAHIGANAVVMTDVPAGAHVVEHPTRVLRLRRVDATAS